MSSMSPISEKSDHSLIIGPPSTAKVVGKCVKKACVKAEKCVASTVTTTLKVAAVSLLILLALGTASRLTRPPELPSELYTCHDRDILESLAIDQRNISRYRDELISFLDKRDQLKEEPFNEFEKDNKIESLEIDRSIREDYLSFEKRIYADLGDECPPLYSCTPFNITRSPQCLESYGSVLSLEQRIEEFNMEIWLTKLLPETFTKTPSKRWKKLTRRMEDRSHKASLVRSQMSQKLGDCVQRQVQQHRKSHR